VAHFEIKWLIIFLALSVQVVIMAVFNDIAMIALSKDRVVPSTSPSTWKLKSIFFQGLVYGLYLTFTTWAL
jgi:H+-transporting ATPase